MRALPGGRRRMRQALLLVAVIGAAGYGVRILAAIVSGDRHTGGAISPLDNAFALMYVTVFALVLGYQRSASSSRFDESLATLGLAVVALMGLLCAFVFKVPY